MKFSPVIVVVAFNRPKSLDRLLCSLKNAKKIKEAKLIISIDNDDFKNLSVKDIADAFEWPLGEKEVIYHPQRLGLRKHVLRCGDYAKEYGSVVILEDDLFVSPFFYDYAVQALSYYDEDEKIGGISLYNEPREEISQKPFMPINDNSDIYFLQFPSSLGQAWTRKQWELFRNWYDTKPDITSIHIPDKVFTWPESSWKKFFCAFLVKFNKFVAFPKISFTTNFNDPGTNLKLRINNEGQTPLKIFDSAYRFINLRESYCKYDVYLELMPECVNMLTSDFKEFDFEMDLYGLKNLEKVTSNYLITSKPVFRSVRSFRRALKPHEMNIIFNLDGDELHLCRKEDARPIRNIRDRFISDYQYYYFRKLPGFKLLLYNFYNNKFRK